MNTDQKKAVVEGLRSFGWTMAIACAIAGALLVWRGKSYAAVFLVLSALFAAFAAVMPKALRPVHRAWMGLAQYLGWIMTRVILFIIFFFVVTPIGLIARLFGKDFLEINFNKKKQSYWNRKEPENLDKSRYEKQF